ncbi:Cytochrome P450, E-class, group I [Parasponia andersonii]|uniref:Cytochrome P450, E-class, group I n=1 Tax=Parasponia andersonii TaxID=3476 RepID=A0A2P5DG98_PARAD|nr:Cytochrome P450, E-class, group I [Parasponia andersonii]
MGLFEILSFFFSTLSVVILLTYFAFKNKLTKKRFNLPPGPPKLPIIGNLHQFGTNREVPPTSLRNLARKYGPIMHLKLGEISTVIISSARLAKEALKVHDLALANRPRIVGAEYLYFDHTGMAFAPYNSYWRYIRKVCILEVLSAKRVQSYTLIRREEVLNLVRRVSEHYPRPVNMSKMVGLYSNSNLCRAAFGREFTEGGDYDNYGFHHMLEEYQELLGGFSIGDFFPSLESVLNLTGTKSRLVHAVSRFNQLFDRIIAEHRDPERVKDETTTDIVDVLLDVQKNASGDMSLSMENVKGLILDVFAAGTDTSTIILDWTMTELMMNPHVMKKVQAEIRSIMGERKVVSETDLPQMNYMKAVIKESLRLHPPAPVLLPRESSEHITIDGYDIPPKTRLYINAWAIGRDPESCEDPETFKPERFLGSSLDYKGTDFEFIPFGAGRRMCPGLSFGTAGVENALAQLLYSFDYELPPGVTAKDLDLSELFGITMSKKVSLELLAKPHFP